MNTNLLKHVNKFLLFLMSLIGVSVTGCNSFGGDMYGVPSTNYRTITGKITDKNNEAIPNIEIELESTLSQSNSLGNYTIITHNSQPDALLRFTDIDGVTNGSFSTKDTTIKLEENEITKLNITLSEEK